MIFFIFIGVIPFSLCSRPYHPSPIHFNSNPSTFLFLLCFHISISPCSSFSHSHCLSSFFLSTHLISLSIRLMVCVIETLVVAVTDGAADAACDCLLMSAEKHISAHFSPAERAVCQPQPLHTFTPPNITVSLHLQPQPGRSNWI